ncbi:MAG TPA: hypothetical protein PKD85_03140 [Saprospiraceae bacterium]|nr:hypothetical protein [Saprospiraceae bacterium]
MHISLQKKLLFAAIVLFIRCDKDLNFYDTCVKDSWIGSFSGSGTCLGRVEPITLFISNTNDLDMVLISNGKEQKSVKVENCKIQITEDIPLFPFPVTGEAVLRGDTLDLRASTLFGVSCSTSILRQ